MVEGLCLFPGCGKPIFKCASPEDCLLACGYLHHFQLMCQRFCSSHPELDPSLRNFYSFRGSSTCGLSSCDLPSSPGHSFCSKSHYLQWMNDFISTCTRQQFCVLPDCARHVFVNSDADKEPGKIYHFCGWKHCQIYNMRISVPSQPDESFASYQSTETDISHAIDSFKSYIQDNIKPPKYALVDEMFFSKHPWEILQPEEPSRIIFAKNIYKGKAGAKKRTTKDGYHWKPTGSEKDFADGVKKKYLTYKKMTGSAADYSDEHKNRCFSIREYTIDSLPGHCVVHLTQSPQKMKLEGSIRKREKLTKNELIRKTVMMYPSESDNNRTVDRFSDMEDPCNDRSFISESDNNRSVDRFSDMEDPCNDRSFISSNGLDGHNVTLLPQDGDDCDIGRFCHMKDDKYSDSLFFQNAEHQNRRSCYIDHGNGSSSSSSVLLQAISSSDGCENNHSRNGSDSIMIYDVDDHTFVIDADGIVFLETFISGDTRAFDHGCEWSAYYECMLSDYGNVFSSAGQQMLEYRSTFTQETTHGAYGIELFH